jgi:hypothetical protein
MEVILISIHSAIIIFITVFSLVKVLKIAYERKEITRMKLRLYVTTAIVVGVFIASALPIGYQKVFDTFLQPYL